MIAINGKYEILTPSGWEDFKGISKISNKKIFQLVLENGNTVRATNGHYFFNNNKKIKLSNLSTGMTIDSTHGCLKIIDIKELGYTTVYDIIEVDNKKHQYIVNNGLITKNCDEFAFVRPTIAKEFWTSISPTLSTGGKAIITSTPSSDEDQFALLWKGANRCIDEFGNPTELGQNGFKAYRADWRAHPDRDEEWAAQQRAALGEERFRREHEIEFIINDETLIAPAKLLDLESTNPIFKTGQVRWFDHPKKSMIYVVALDPSLGTGGDPAAIQVFEANTSRQIAEWKHNRTTIPQQIRIMAEICKHINETTANPEQIYYSVENNTIGEAALISINEYGEENIAGYFLSDSNSPRGRRHRKGFTTSNTAKLAACAKMKNLIETGRMQIKSAALISQLKTFVASGASYAAKPGEHDDLVMATVLVVRMMQQLQGYHAELSPQLTDHIDQHKEPLPFVALL